MDLPPSRKRDAPLIDVYGFSAPCDYGGAGILSRFSPSLSPLASLFFSRSIWGATEALRRRLASIDFITRLGRSSIQSRGLLLVLGYFCEFPRELRQGRLLAEDLREPVADVRPLCIAETVGDAVCGRRKFNTTYIDHTEGSKKANSGWEKLRRFPNIIFFMYGVLTWV